MLECKICRINLYKNITFSNMFKMNYEVHQECIDKLEFNTEELVIPIESHIIIYDYILKRKSTDYNEEYLWFIYFGIIIKKYIDSDEWSMIIFYDKNIEYFIRNNNPYLLLNLTSNPILLLSIEEKNLSYLEGL